jgi:probable addiction module antidote protein
MLLERVQEVVMKKSTAYQPNLIECLRDAGEAEEYLNAALEEDDPELFLLALRNVAEAQGGVGQLAEKAKLNRESLYKMLSERGNPELRSLDALLHALGFRLAVTATR